MDNIEHWLQKLGAKPLPIMELTYKQVQQLLKQKNTSYTDLTPTIKRDPGFSLAVLRAINKTPRKGKDPIADIGRAIPLLGMAWLEEAAEKLPIIRQTGPADKCKAIFRCYSRALHASRYASHLAQQRNDHDPNELSSTALMEGIGEMALWVNSYAVAQKIQSLIDEGLDRNEATTPWLGLSFDELSTALRNHWNLPNLRPQENCPEDARPQRETGVTLACAISQVSEFSWYNKTIQKLYQQAAEYINVEADQASSDLRSVAIETARILHPLGLPCPAFNILLPPNVKKKAQKTKRVTSHLQSPVKLNQQPSAQKPLPTKTTPIKSESKKPASKPKQSFSTFIKQIMGEIQKTAEVKRVTFMTISQDGKYLAARLILDQVKDSKIHQFKVEASPKNIFGLLMSGPNSLWMNTENLVKYGHLIPEQASCTLGTQQFFAVSLFSKTKPIGLMYADDGPGITKLDAVRYDKFMLLSKQIETAVNTR